ncbi:MAG: DNA polymerase III subunit alpha [Gammaproteobacteria bacterium]|nr:DNA polymerase III subunit alpha [Gammaproteobacteria bacterium]
MTADFVHLHLHTEYSLTDGLVRVGPLMDAVRDAAMPAVALTDYSNLFALVKFYRAAVARGIKPIIGVDTLIAGEGNAPASRLVLLCQNDTGYRNLTRLVTRAHLEGQAGGAPQLQHAWLAEANAGLIALSGGRYGDVGRALLAGEDAAAQTCLAFWREYFPARFYLELNRTGRDDEERYLAAAVELAVTSGTPVVATNDVRFLKREEFDVHEARVCIRDGRVLNDPRRPHQYSEQQYLRTPEEMSELFRDLPEALENSVEIARRCSLSLQFGQNVLPEFPTPAGMTADEYFTTQAREGLTARLRTLPAGFDEARAAPYRERLETELKIILSMRYPGYFLIVADFIRWARENGVPVGPGRGSGAGSLVAYALGITDLDPIHYDLLFERFLNPERVSMPDFDIDFCMDGRDRVIDYVAERYGRDRVSQIITYGRMAAKAVVRDVGRVLGHPYGFIDRVAKLIPFEIGMTLEKALKQEPELRQMYDDEEDVHAIIDMARALEGLARNAGKHAGGVVIAPSRLTDFTPLYCEPGAGSVVTQLDKDDVEAIGLVKFDFLGLRTLTIIDRALANINARAGGEAGLKIDTLPLDDVATFALLKKCQTTAVFQLESRGMKELIKRLQPDSFEDIIALVALFRPGPLQSGMVDDFIDRKHGRAKVNYPHHALEVILKPTYGVILYQEQVMQIAREMAGYTLGAADLLRRAMGKKKASEMAKQREIFVTGSVERGVKSDTATYIFDLMEKFAGYGFNKSHSAAYALLSYQTAWLKTHHPAAFMAAVLSADMDNTDKVVNLIEECRGLGLEVVPPDINRSVYAFTVHDDKTILYGLGAIKGVGQGVIEALLAQREEAGFDSLSALCRRAGTHKLNRRALEALVRAGSLDAIGHNRATLMAQVPDALRLAEQHSRDASAGQVDLFGAAATPREALIELPGWGEDQRLNGEKETLGLYLTGHPISRYATELAKIARRRIGEVVSESSFEADAGYGRREQQSVVLAGLVVSIRTRNTQSGRMAFVTLDDRSGRIEVGVFTENYRRYASLLIPDKILIVEGVLGFDEYRGQMRVRASQLMDIDEARARYACGLEIHLAPRQDNLSLIGDLRDALTPYRNGPCPLQVAYINGRAAARLALGDAWKINPSDALLARLRGMRGIDKVEVVYA